MGIWKDLSLTANTMDGFLVFQSKVISVMPSWFGCIVYVCLEIVFTNGETGSPFIAERLKLLSLSCRAIKAFLFSSMGLSLNAGNRCPHTRFMMAPISEVPDVMANTASCLGNTIQYCPKAPSPR